MEQGAEYYQGEPIHIDKNQWYSWMKTPPDPSKAHPTDSWPYDGDPVDESDDLPTVQPE